MKHTPISSRPLRISVCLILAAFTGPAFAGWASTRLETKQEIFAFADKNGDRNIDPAERGQLDIAFATRGDLHLLDLNRNGKLDREEVDALERSCKPSNSEKRKEKKQEERDKNSRKNSERIANIITFMTLSHPSFLRGAACGAVLCGLFTAADAPAQQAPEAAAWSLRPVEKPVQLAGFMGALDLSGIAKAGNHLLVVSDELTGVQIGAFNETARTITYSTALSLVTAEPSKKGGKKKDGGKGRAEIDAEGICFAADEKAFYVAGSHGVGKKKGDFQPLRFSVYRVPMDPDTGAMRVADIGQSTLLTWLETSAEFKDHLRQPLQQNGFNIEGLACAGGRLYFGVRGPNLDGKAGIIEVDAKELFRRAGAGIQPKVHLIPVGPDKGIRELAAVNGGFLMITGNACAEASKQFPETTARQPDSGFALSFLPSSGAGNIGSPQLIGDVSAEEGKAEGLLVLKDADGIIEILVLHDGLEQGGATMFTMHRPGTAKKVASAAK